MNIDELAVQSSAPNLLTKPKTAIIRKFNIGDIVYYISHENIIETTIKSFKRITSTGISRSKDRPIKPSGVSYQYTDIVGNRFEEWFLFKEKESAQKVLDNYKKRIEELTKPKDMDTVSLTSDEMTNNQNNTND